ncbi:hypothetical protein ATANTOWER_024560 [Ataeniobius toweri]|uniref:Uncharacterized protein n=1 Tax=Ataeniobius toweri TaxID=208326 RepID=A0ABU7C0T8_9TELE|nr:hypothetical protein [Ataeniobius toweri]
MLHVEWSYGSQLWILNLHLHRNSGPHLPAASAGSYRILQPARSPTTGITFSDSPDFWPTDCAQDPPEKFCYQETTSLRTKTQRPETVIL